MPPIRCLRSKKFNSILPSNRLKQRRIIILPNWIRRSVRLCYEFFVVLNESLMVPRSSPSTLSSLAWSSVPRCPKRMHSSALLLSSPSFTLSMPSPRPSPTLSGGVFPPISLSRPLSHPVTRMTCSGSRIGLSSAFSILPRALRSVHYSTISRGIFHSRHCSFFGCNFPHFASVSHYFPILLDSLLSHFLGCATGLL